MKSFAHIPQSRLSRWNRRQRKKLRLGEFQELGFTLNLHFSPPLDDAAADLFWDAILTHIESLGLCAGLGGRLPMAELEGFVSAAGRGTVTTEQQAQVLAWCRARPEVRVADAGELVDAWHGWAGD